MDMLVWQLWTLAIILVFGQVDCCTILQTCTGCEMSADCRNGNMHLDLSEDECALLVDGTTVVAVDYRPMEWISFWNAKPSECWEGSCDRVEKSISNPDSRFSRFTCNAECTAFSLQEAMDTRISDTKIADDKDMNIGECLRMCFDTPGSYMCDYNHTHNDCQVYACGHSCVTTAGETSFLTYTRFCECDDPTDPANGNADIFSGGASYSCHIGYSLSEGPITDWFGTKHTTRSCQSNGTWSNPPTCDTVDCGSLSPPVKGAVNVNGGTTYGESATYTCSVGYALAGTSPRTCQSSGTWSGTEPSCSLIDCGSLSSPTDGTVSTFGGTLNGQTATYMCNVGYDLVGTNTRTCQPSGTWSSTEPSCSLIDCGSLSSPTDGTVSTTGGTTNGQTATYMCNVGYDLVGQNTRTCQSSGTWSGTEPSCTLVDCGSLSSPTDGTVSTTSGTTNGQTATYMCNVGHDLVGQNTRTCQSSGTWSGTEPSCSLTDCGSLSSPTDGTVSTTGGTTNGQTATYICNVGYDLVGQNTRACQSSGTWSGTQPSCSLVDCGSLSSPTDGTVSTTGGTTNGQTATYMCNVGHDLVGQNTRTCHSSGTWSGTEPSCSLVDCGSISSPTDGTVSTTDGTTNGQTATYMCNVGYDLVGQNTRTCQSSATWSGTEPSCSLVDCGSLSSPIDGTVSTTGGTTYGETATYMCTVGYGLAGTNPRICQATGTWSGTEPSCSLVDCGSLPSPVNGSVYTAGGTTYGQMATYLCEVGHNISDTSSRTCLNTGDWSGTSPTCILIDCGSLTEPTNGTVDISNGTTYGARATYSCTMGYSLVGTDTRICLPDGTWNDTEPTCSLIDCGTLSSPAYGIVETLDGTTYGKKATYTCSSGYVLSYNAPRTCTDNGAWSSSAPVCRDEATAPVKLYLYPCICYPNKTFTGKTQEEIIAYLIAETSIDVSNTSLARSKLSCRSDLRQSSRIVGLVGIVFMSVVFGGLALLDVLTVCRICKGNANLNE